MQPSAEGKEYWAIGADAALERLGATRLGLSEAEAERRLAVHGPNRLPAGRRRSALMRFALQFHNVLIYVLLAAAFVTALMQHWIDTAVIVAVVVINAIIGFIQEGKAEEAMEAVRNMLSLHATVIRDGQRVVIDATDVAPGDIVYVQSGDRIPADIRLIRVKSLKVQELALTGESLPVDKDPAPVMADVPLGDRAPMAYSGTVVTYGQGTGVVVATGAATEIGRINAMLSEVETLSTPLLQRMDEFARWLTVVILVVCAAVFAFGALVWEFRRRRDVHGGGRARGFGDPRRIAGDHHHYAGDRRGAHGAAQGDHPPTAGGRDARRGDDNLLGQDRHADAQ